MGRDFDALLGFIVAMLGTALVVKIIDDASKKAKYKCPRCNVVISRGQNPCPSCMSPVRWI